MNLAGTIPGWTRFPPAQEMLDQNRGAAQDRSEPWRARRRHAPRPTIQPSRSGCSSSSWSGASNRSDDRPFDDPLPTPFMRALAERVTSWGGKGLPADRRGGARDRPRCSTCGWWEGAVCDRCCAWRWRLRSGPWPSRPAIPRPGAGSASRRRSKELVSIKVAPVTARRGGLEAAAARSRSAPRTRSPRTASFAFAACLPTVALSEGHAIAPGAWAVPLAALADVSASFCRPASRGQSEVAISLVSVEGAVLAEAKTTLDRRPLPGQDASSPSAAAAERRARRRGSQAQIRPSASARWAFTPRVWSSSSAATCLLRASSSSAPPRRDWRRARWPPRAPTIQTSWPSSASSACSPTSRRHANGTRRRASSAPPRPASAAAARVALSLPPDLRP